VQVDGQLKTGRDLAGRPDGEDEIAFPKMDVQENDLVSYRMSLGSPKVFSWNSRSTCFSFDDGVCLDPVLRQHRHHLQGRHRIDGFHYNLFSNHCGYTPTTTKRNKASSSLTRAFFTFTLVPPAP
jgi:hypothetical protein